MFAEQDGAHVKSHSPYLLAELQQKINIFFVFVMIFRNSVSIEFF